MQMDAEFKKEQNGTLLSGGGTGRGVWGVGGPSGVSTPNSIRAFQERIKNTLLLQLMFFLLRKRRAIKI
jgi:hypothetical protein